MPDTRFCLDESSSVVDTLALFVLDTFTTQENIMDPRFSFYVNRVFKEYLFPKDIFDINEYVPLDIALLMARLDTSSYRWLTFYWQQRFNHLRFQSKISVDAKNFTSGCEASCWFVLNEKRHRVTKIVNETLTLSTLHCLAQLAYDTSVTVRTVQYRSALKDLTYPPSEHSR